VSFTFHSALQPTAVVYSIAGRITHEDTTSELIASLAAALEKHIAYVLIDLSELTYISSSGLNFFIRVLTRTRNAGGELLLCGVRGEVEKLFALSKLNEIFTIYPSIEQGLAKINAQ
jgi:anti-sigma B factor antagonist